MSRDLFTRRDHYIRSELASHRPPVTLDVGCGGVQRRDFVAGLPYFSSDIRIDKLVDLRGSGLDLPIASQSVGAVLALEVIEHVPDPNRLVHELARVLSPGGVAFISAPSAVPRHDDQDYWRFTAQGLSEICARHFNACEIHVFGGTFETLASLGGYYFSAFAHHTWTPLRRISAPFITLGRALDERYTWSTSTEGLHTLAYDLLAVARQPMP